MGQCCSEPRPQEVVEWSDLSPQEVDARTASGCWVIYYYSEQYAACDCQQISDYAETTATVRCAELCPTRHAGYERFPDLRDSLPMLRFIRNGQEYARHRGSFTAPLVHRLVNTVPRIRPGSLSAAVFDLDGTLIDYEGLSHVALNEGLCGHGEVSWELHASIIGTRPEDWGRKILEALQIPPETFTLAQYTEAYIDCVHARLDEIPPMKGAHELLDELTARRVPMAIATSSQRHSFEQKMTKHPEMLSKMKVCITGDDPAVKRGKPAPDIFSEAARRLGVDPNQCIAFEDSPHGVAAAVAAGMWVVAIPDPRLPGNDFSAAHWVVSSLSEFADILRSS